LNGSTRSGVAIAGIPLLYETGRERDFDVVVVTICQPQQQIARLIARTGLSPEDAARRVEAQLPAAEKARLADHVIDTSGSFEETNAQVDAVWAKLN
jgi:dephospho-CoA kinase